MTAPVPPPQPVASDEADEVAKNLCPDDYYGQSPSPEAASEPSDPRSDEGGSEEKKEDAGLSTKQSELLVRRRIESPNMVKRCSGQE